MKDILFSADVARLALVFALLALPLIYDMLRVAFAR